MSSFAERLLHARSDSGLTQRELSEKTGISTVQLSRYESGKSAPRPPVLMKLAKALSVNHEWLGGNDAFEKDETYEYELELPPDLYDKSESIAKDLGVPLELFAKYMLFLGGSRLDTLPQEDRDLMQTQADRLKKRIDSISSVKRKIKP